MTLNVDRLQQKMSKSEQLKSFIKNNILLLEMDVGGWREVKAPSFELYARDYLEFAQQELDKKTVVSLINCVSHLKRAADCQIDIFFHVYNLHKIFNKRNLKFEKKLDFLGEAGIFTSRSLTRFNTIRNKMEHNYEAPKIDDIEVYFDLVFALITILERLTALHSEITFVTYGDLNAINGGFSIEYVEDEPCIKVVLGYGDGSEELMVSAEEEIEEFAYFFKTLIVLSQYILQCVSPNYVVSQLVC